MVIEQDNSGEKFLVRLSGQDDIDYLTFCYELNTFAGSQASIS
jgi:hypothetical protein